MKLLLSLFLLINSALTMADTSVVDAEKFQSFLQSLKDDPTPSIDRYDHLRRTRTIGFIAKGPILHGEGTKYGLEYMLEATGPYDINTKEYEIETVEISYMEVTYCDYQYANDEDYRFRRLSLKLNTKAVFQDLLEYKLQYSADNNDGKCNDVSTPTAVSNPQQPFGSKMRALFKTVIGQWIGDRAAE